MFSHFFLKFDAVSDIRSRLERSGLLTDDEGGTRDVATQEKRASAKRKRSRKKKAGGSFSRFRRISNKHMTDQTNTMRQEEAAVEEALEKASIH